MEGGTMVVKERKPKAAPPTMEEIQERKTRERITAYRELVARAASGDRLNDADMEQASELLEALGLPPFAWARDVEGRREHDAVAAEELRLRDAEPARRAREAELNERITTLEAELKTLTLEQRNVVLGDQGRVLNVMRRLNELRMLHPHVLADIEQAVSWRMEQRLKAMTPTTPPGSSDVEGWGS
jgi:hypothetical protein